MPKCSTAGSASAGAWRSSGGIGFDVAEFLLGDQTESTPPARFLQAWNVDPHDANAGALGGIVRSEEHNPDRREVTILQRKPTRLGRSLGKSTGARGRTA